MRNSIPIERALISVSDKSFLPNLLAGLYSVNPKMDILSSGGTHREINGMGYSAREVAEYTLFPESPDGLLKTLHPGVHGGILLNREIPTHAQYMDGNGQMQILPIGLVVVNFYPFSQMVKDGAKLEKLRLKGIDIGGPSMVRSAAKSFPHVAVVTDSKSYEIFMEDFSKEGTTNPSTRFRLAQRAFDLVEVYDREIAEYLRTLDPDAVAEYYRALEVHKLKEEVK